MTIQLLIKQFRDNRHDQMCRAEPTAAASIAEGITKEGSRVRLAEMVAKKREIFLVQMGLDIKKQEIQKLQQRSLQRAQALDKAENLLAEDSKKFEAFLKQNAESLQEAVSYADTQTRAKNEKVGQLGQCKS